VEHITLLYLQAYPLLTMLLLMAAQGVIRLLHEVAAVAVELLD
jgi:hypothetical protein